MTQVLDIVRAHLRGHFAGAEPDSASVTFLGVERIEILRFGPGPDGLVHYVSLGCSRHPMGDPTQLAADPLHGPRAELVVSLRDSVPTPGIARAIALLAATPAVDGVVLQQDALIDLGATLWEGARVSAVVLGRSEIPDATLDPPREPVVFLSATPISANEAAWVRLKGIDELRRTWEQDGVDVRDPARL
ncbi:Suppressor of fused protein (SUFU) [Mycobacterium sp. MS1601]|uniref:suppressor of fused domain protein n=1 Tax=Mycobacterium sp. MS1601 TaxID=1936029 RepID=UPI000979596C|nr:suppressor of fused domain protein [Mycobacterium sp. MS1601]AQA04115.1 Suppressor of fused protein (SUFU) [Mycobacterium sp. MS1601]